MTRKLLILATILFSSGPVVFCQDRLNRIMSVTFERDYHSGWIWYAEIPITVNKFMTNSPEYILGESYECNKTHATKKSCKDCFLSKHSKEKWREVKSGKLDGTTSR